MSCTLPQVLCDLAKSLQRPATRFLKRLPGLALIALAGFSSVLFVNKASERKLSDLENIQFQIITMSIGLTGSYLLGGVTAREAAEDVVRPHAKSAFRRVMALYASLARLHITMDKVKPTLVATPQAIAAIERFQDLVTEQINTSGNTIDDWGDLVPDEVAKVKEQSAALQGDTLNQ
jgi:hypothetical protein